MRFGDVKAEYWNWAAGTEVA